MRLNVYITQRSKTMLIAWLFKTLTSSFNKSKLTKPFDFQNKPKFGTPNPDRKRFIFKATPVEQDNSTLYDTTEN